MLNILVLETSFFPFLSKVTKITFSLQTEKMRINEMEDCDPGYAIRRKDKQTVEIQKRGQEAQGASPGWIANVPSDT